MPVDFTRYSAYNKDAGFISIRFGADIPLLETELNELQQIIVDRQREFIMSKFGDGFIGDGTLTYSGGNVTLSNQKAMINGWLINISSLTTAVTNGQTAYLEVWEQEITRSSTIRRFGNQQESSIANYLIDNRLQEESTRRYQVAYNIVKTNNTVGRFYLPIASVSGGVMTDSRTFAGNPVVTVGPIEPTVKSAGDIWVKP